VVYFFIAINSPFGQITLSPLWRTKKQTKRFVSQFSFVGYFVLLTLTIINHKNEQNKSFKKAKIKIG